MIRSKAHLAEIEAQAKKRKEKFWSENPDLIRDYGGNRRLTEFKEDMPEE